MQPVFDLLQPIARKADDRPYLVPEDNPFLCTNLIFLCNKSPLSCIHVLGASLPVQAAAPGGGTPC